MSSKAEKQKGFAKHLTMLERSVLFGILPQKGSFDTNSIVEKLQTELSPSEEDHKNYDITYTFKCSLCGTEIVSPISPNCPVCLSKTGKRYKMQNTYKMHWSPDKAELTKEITFGTRALQIVIDTLKSLHDSEELPAAANSLYKKFVLAHKEE